jgi:hypothetical protein
MRLGTPGALHRHPEPEAVAALLDVTTDSANAAGRSQASAPIARAAAMPVAFISMRLLDAPAGGSR